MKQLEGHTIKTAENGVEALKLIHEHQFDLVVADYLMPQMNGINLIERLREEKNYVPFIFISANAGKEHTQKMSNYGPYEFIPEEEIIKLPEAIKRHLYESKNVLKMIRSSNENTKEFVNLLHAIKF